MLNLQSPQQIIPKREPLSINHRGLHHDKVVLCASHGLRDDGNSNLRSEMIKIFFALVAVTVSFVWVCSGLTQETRIKFAIGEWAPYTAENIENFGMAAELVLAACTASGLEIEYDFVPWKRAEKLVATGSHFGTFPYKEIPERNNTYLFSKTLFSSSFGILVHKTHTPLIGGTFQKAADFKGFTVGIVAGTDALKIPLEKAGAKIEEVPTGDQNLRKLLTDRIDFYIDDKAVIFQAMKKTSSSEQSSEFEFLKNDFGEKNEFKIMVSKKYANSVGLLDKINAGIDTVTASGEQKAILAKYGL